MKFQIPTLLFFLSTAFASGPIPTASEILTEALQKEPNFPEYMKVASSWMFTLQNVVFGSGAVCEEEKVNCTEIRPQEQGDRVLLINYDDHGEYFRAFYNKKTKTIENLSSGFMHVSQYDDKGYTLITIHSVAFEVEYSYYAGILRSVSYEPSVGQMRVLITYSQLKKTIDIANASQANPSQITYECSSWNYVSSRRSSVSGKTQTYYFPVACGIQLLKREGVALL